MLLCIRLTAVLVFTLINYKGDTPVEKTNQCDHREAEL